MQNGKIYLYVLFGYFLFGLIFFGVGDDVFLKNKFIFEVVNFLRPHIAGVENIMLYSKFPISAAFWFLFSNFSVLFVGLWVSIAGNGGFMLPEHDRYMNVIFSLFLFPVFYLVLMHFFMSDPYGSSKASSIELKMSMSPTMFSLATAILASFNTFGVALLCTSAKEFFRYYVVKRDSHDNGAQL